MSDERGTRAAAGLGLAGPAGGRRHGPAHDARDHHGARPRADARRARRLRPAHLAGRLPADRAERGRNRRGAQHVGGGRRRRARRRLLHRRRAVRGRGAGRGPRRWRRSEACCRWASTFRTRRATRRCSAPAARRRDRRRLAAHRVSATRCGPARCSWPRPPRRSAALLAYAGLVLGLALGGAPLWLVIGASGAIPLLAGARLRGAAAGAAAALPRCGARWSGGRPARDLLAVGRLGGAHRGRRRGHLRGQPGDPRPVRLAREGRALRGARCARTTCCARSPPPPRSRRCPPRRASSPRATSHGWRELLLRGCRYSLALVVPIAVTGMVLAAPVLDVWLGDGVPLGRRRDGDHARPLDGQRMRGRARRSDHRGRPGAVAGPLRGWRWPPATWSWRWPWCRAWGSTARPSPPPCPTCWRSRGSPRWRSSWRAARGRDLLREAFAPAWALALVLAGALGALRLTVDLDSLPALAAVAVPGAVGLYWAAFYGLFMRPRRAQARARRRPEAGARWLRTARCASSRSRRGTRARGRRSSVCSRSSSSWRWETCARTGRSLSRSGARASTTSRCGGPRSGRAASAPTFARGPRGGSCARTWSSTAAARPRGRASSPAGTCGACSGRPARPSTRPPRSSAGSTSSTPT